MVLEKSLTAWQAFLDARFPKSPDLSFPAEYFSTARSMGGFPWITLPVFLSTGGLPRSSSARLIASAGSFVPSLTLTCLPSYV